MIITGLNTIYGKLDLSALQRLQEDNPIENASFHLAIKAGDVVEVNDKYCGLISVQNALKLGLIEIQIPASNCNVFALQGITGYDPTKKQSLANIDGVVMWYTARDCNGKDA